MGTSSTSAMGSHTDEPTSGARERLESAEQVARGSHHAIHFLERLERLTESQVELALTLYRDEALLAEVLRSIKLPDGAERVAISLDDDREGPFVIVTRAGRFVTCLGYGMSVDRRVTPLVSRARLMAASQKVTRMRERIAAVERAASGVSEVSRIFSGMLDATIGVAREDVETLLRVQPLLGSWCAAELHGWMQLVEQARAVVARLSFEQLCSRDYQLVVELDRAHRMVSHLAVIADPQAVESELSGVTVEPWWTLAATIFESGTFDAAARALSLVARHAPEVTPWVTADRTGATSMPIALLRALSGSTVAMVSPNDRARVSVARARRRSGSVGATSLDRYVQSVRSFSVAADDMAHTVEQRPEHFARIAAACGRQILEGLDPSVTAVSDPVAHAALATYPESFLSLDDDSLTMLSSLLPVVARARPEELYLPRRWASRLPRPHHALAVQTLAPFAARLDLRARPARSQERVGRNERCICGSGKKYKRCCGTH